MVPSPKLNESRQMPTWEYLTTPLVIHNTQAILNNWGAQGWELVQVIPGPEGGSGRLPQARETGVTCPESTIVLPSSG